MALNSNGFADRLDLEEHFDFHVDERKEFPHITTEEEYEEAADRFLTEPRISSKCHECYRQKPDGTEGDMIRYNKQTGEFGVLSSENIIRTYFIVDIECHGKDSNYLYFKSECDKVSS